MATLQDYMAAAELIYPGLGESTYAEFNRFNRLYFGGELPPMPIQWHHTLPYGRSLGLAYPHQVIHLGIYSHRQWCVTDGRLTPFGEHVLLHEMIHQHLFIAGLDSNHNSESWCSEIMRIGAKLGIKPFIASPSKVIKVRDDTGRRKSKRVTPGIPMEMICRFPSFAFDYTPNTATLKPDWRPIQ